MTTVGVVIPAYNPGPLLRRALDSVIDQTYSDWRAVVVDDGSSEDLGWVASSHPQVELIRQTNVGVSQARNAGVNALDSEFIAFLDQDDVWHPQKLELQVDALSKSPDAAFCHTEFTWVLPDRSTQATYDEPVTHAGLLTDQHVLLSSMVVSRARYLEVGGHDPTLAMVQDYDLFLRLTMDGAVPICVHGSLVDYHVHGENASTDYRLGHTEGVRVIRAYGERARFNGDLLTARAAEEGVRKAHRLYAEQALQQYRAVPGRMRGLNHLVHALVWDPKGVGRQAARVALKRRQAAGEGSITGSRPR